MSRLIALLIAAAFCFALPAFAQTKAEEKKETMGQKAREAGKKTKEEAKKAERKAKKDAKKAEQK